MVNQADLTGVLLFIGLVVTLGFLVWSYFRSCKHENGNANVAETPDSDPRYESDEQRQPWDSDDIDASNSPISMESNGNGQATYCGVDVAETSDSDPRTTHEDFEKENNWEYVTEIVDPNIPAKRVDDPLPSDQYVVEKNKLGEYRSVPKQEWIARVHEDSPVDRDTSKEVVVEE